MLTFILMLTACEDRDKDEEQKQRELLRLQEYLERNNITQAPTSTGMYYIQLVSGEGRSPEDGSWVDIQFTGRLISGTVFETNIEQVAREQGLYDPNMIYGLTRLYYSDITMAGLKEGISYMSVGETARLIIPSDLGLGAATRPLIPAYSTLIFDVVLLDEFNDPAVHEVEALIEYFGDPLAYADTTPEGIYYFEQERGWGDTINQGDEVEIWYTGSFLDGRVFDHNREDNTPLLIHYPDQDDVLPGIMNSLKYMRGGSKVRLVIPYRFGYGDKGAENIYGYTVVPPYMTLVFDIEVNAVY